MHGRRHVVDAGRALEAGDGLDLIADLGALEALALLDGLGRDLHAVPPARRPIRIAVLVFRLPRHQELGDFRLHRAVGQCFVDLRRRCDKEKLVAEHLRHRAKYREVLHACQHQHVEPELLDVLGSCQSGAAEADLEDRASAGCMHLADLHAEIGVVLLVLFDSDELQAVVGRGLLGDVLLQNRIGRWVVQHADLFDLGFVLEILKSGRDLETGRRQGAERPFHVVGVLRQDRTEHHRDLCAHRERRAGEIPSRDAARKEDISLVGDHLAIDRHRLLRLGLVVLGHHLDLAAHDAALGIECGSRDLDAVPPAAIDCCRIAGEARGNADLVSLLRAGLCDRQRGRQSGQCREFFIRHDFPPFGLF